MVHLRVHWQTSQKYCGISFPRNNIVQVYIRIFLFCRVICCLFYFRVYTEYFYEWQPSQIGAKYITRCRKKNIFLAFLFLFSGLWEAASVLILEASRIHKQTNMSSSYVHLLSGKICVLVEHTYKIYTFMPIYTTSYCS